MVDQWLNQEPRLRASIVVPAQAPLLAVEEIERLAPVTSRFVQVLMPAACEMMLGRSYYWPIYEAAVRDDLPIGIHAGSMYRYAPTSGGWPSHYLHDYVANSQIFEDQLLSLISNGVFNLSRSALRADRIGRDLAARLHLARGQDLARRARRGAMGEALAGRDDSRQRPADRAAIDAPRDTECSSAIIEQIDCDRHAAVCVGLSALAVRGRRGAAGGCRPLCCNAFGSTIRWKPILD